MKASDTGDDDCLTGRQKDDASILYSLKGLLISCHPHTSHPPFRETDLVRACIAGLPLQCISYMRSLNCMLTDRVLCEVSCAGTVCEEEDAVTATDSDDQEGVRLL